jgi:predicted RNA-binding protein with PIN domain
MERLLYIVDGYNVLHAAFTSIAAGELEERRDWLVERLTSFAALRGANVVVVFDVRGRRGVDSHTVAGSQVEVAFAGGHLAADALIARRIAAQPADVTVFVVSGDQEVQRTAARAGVHRMTPRELLGSLNDLRTEANETLAKPSTSCRMRSQLEDKVDVETLHKLERLRREGGGSRSGDD